MIHLAGPYAVAALLVGLGVAGVLLRRNAVLVLVGIELILSGGLVLLLATGARGSGATRVRWEAGSVLPLFVITIAAAEVVLALAVILAVFRQSASIDVDRATASSPLPESATRQPALPDPAQPGPSQPEGPRFDGPPPEPR